MPRIGVTLARVKIVTAFMFCAGCATNQLNANLASWQGSHIDEVASAWGDPNGCGVSDGQTICTWSDEADGRAAGEPPVPGMAGDQLLARPACMRMLAVDQSGYVTGWRWRGNRCPASVAVARGP